MRLVGVGARARQPALPTYAGEDAPVDRAVATRRGLEQSSRLSRGCTWRWLDAPRVRRNHTQHDTPDTQRRACTHSASPASQLPLAHLHLYRLGCAPRHTSPSWVLAALT